MFNPSKHKDFSFHLTTNEAETKNSINILEIANNGKVVELYPKKDNRNNNNNVIQKSIRKSDSLKNTENIDANEIKCKNIYSKEKRILLSLQVISLKNALKFSKMIYITPIIYIKNLTNRNLHIFHFSKKDKSCVIDDLTNNNNIMHFYYLSGYYEFIKISFEKFFNNDDSSLYSGLIKFIPNTEFYIELSEREKYNFLI